MELLGTVMTLASKVQQKIAHLAACDLSPLSDPIGWLFLLPARPMPDPNHPRALATSYSASPAYLYGFQQFIERSHMVHNTSWFF